MPISDDETGFFHDSLGHWAEPSRPSERAADFDADDAGVAAADDNTVGEPPSQSWLRSTGRWIKFTILLWFTLKFAGCVLMLEGPWGPRVGGVLPDGTTVHFQARPVGGETDDRLIVQRPGESPQHFWVDRIHAGFAHVTIKYLDSHRVWVESDGEVGASIDLSNGDFRPEHAEQHPWAVMHAGTELASGDTHSLLWLIGPW